MKSIPREQIRRRLEADNPWWDNVAAIEDFLRGLRPRAYFESFLPLVVDRSVRRAIILMGPRRVGKTVMLWHTIQALLNDNVRPKRVCYISVDHPLYTGCSIEDLLECYAEASEVDIRSEDVYVFLDEIQYLKDWETHVKFLVDRHPNLKVVVSGSAAAALRLKSIESGAGRFTDFLLPPLTFYEFLELKGESTIVEYNQEESYATTQNIDRVNTLFVEYLNFGGYPEVVLSDTIRENPIRFVKNDIIDKVLLRDLPSLYGIRDVQELNLLFTSIAFNTAQEISLDALSRSSGVAKNTIKKYIEYLEAAFLIKVIHRVDRTARRFERATAFKVYLTNPSMRSALFSEIDDTSESFGAVVETAIYAQWFHSGTPLYYARWSDGEVDMVHITGAQRADWAVEVKWSDRLAAFPNELVSLRKFCEASHVREALVTTKTQRKSVTFSTGLEVDFVPASLYCYVIGRRGIHTPRWARQSVL